VRHRPLLLYGSLVLVAGVQESVVVSAVDAVDAEVRELVRCRGLDPFEDRATMRRLVDEVVSDYDERARTSSLVPLPDSRSAARAVYHAVARLRAAAAAPGRPDGRGDLDQRAGSGLRRAAGPS
jgi:hypothetical protein